MNQHRKSGLLLGVLVSLGAAGLLAAYHPAPRRAGVSASGTVAGQPGHGSLAEAYGQLPLTFEEVGGAPAGGYATRGPGYHVALRPTDLTLSLETAHGASRRAASARVRMRLAGANPGADLRGSARPSGTVSYLLGNDPGKWRVDLPTYSQVTARGVYSGVDLIYYGSQRQLEYDFRVRPHADPAQIRMRYDGVLQTHVDAAGDLVLATAAGSLRQPRPFAYQEDGGVRRLVAAGYTVAADHTVRIALGEYDRTRELVIDPVLVYAGCLPQLGESGATAVAVDPSGAAYVTGWTRVSGSKPPCAFVTKLDATGRRVVYTAYVGGHGGEQSHAIAVDRAGEAVVAGATTSTDFPQVGAGGDLHEGAGADAFLCRLNAQGTGYVYSRRFGGAGWDSATGVALDTEGSTYVVGSSEDLGIPRLNGAQAEPAGGTDGFLLKLDAVGSRVQYATYLGGSGPDAPQALALSGAGTAYVVGETGSGDLQVHGASQAALAGTADAFVARIDTRVAGRASLGFLTYLGGSGVERASGVALDARGGACVVGESSSTDFPGDGNVQAEPHGFLARYSTNGDLVSAAVPVDGSAAVVTAVALGSGGETWVAGNSAAEAFIAQVNALNAGQDRPARFGGTGNEQAAGMAVDSSGRIIVVGSTTSSDFPGSGARGVTTARPTATQAFIARFDPQPARGVTLRQNAAPGQPTAGNDTYSTHRNTTRTVAAPGVLVNDSDPNALPLTAVKVSDPVHGTLTLNGNGSFTYVPALNYVGADSFTYQASNGTQSSATATVTLSVTNTPPVAISDSYSVRYNGVLNVPAPGIMLNDFDPDGDPITIESTTPTTPWVVTTAHGTFTVRYDGSLTYVPDGVFVGGDAITYRCNDGTSNSNFGTLFVNVTDTAPVANTDNYSTPQDSSLNVAAPGVLANDTDADGDPLTAAKVANPTHGSVTLNANGSFTYIPVAGYSGSDSFTYRVSDGRIFSNTTTVFLSVAHVNHPPTAQNDAYTLAEDTVLAVSAPGLLANDTDPDGDALTAVVVSGPAHGSVTVNASGAFSYAPSANYNGPDSFTYRASDGPASSAPATVALTVTPVNDPPGAPNQSVTTNEDSALTITLVGTDVEGSALTYIVTASPAHGTLSGSAPNLVYTPAPDYNGSDSFTYTVNDGQAGSNVGTVSITVTPVNDPPTAADATFSVNEDQPLVIAAPGVLSGAHDVDGDTLTATATNAPVHGAVSVNADGSFIYLPDPDYNGADSFSYRASDGQVSSGTATVSVIVAPVNDPPTATSQTVTTPEDTALSVILGATDAEGDALTYAVVSAPSHGTLIGTAPNVIYTPAADYNGPDSFTFRANDGQSQSNPGAVTITVTPVNDPPVAANDAYSVNEDQALVVAAPGVLGGDTDVDGDTLTAGVLSQPAHGALSLNADGSFTYLPDADYHGSDGFSYRATDGLASSNTAMVTLTVIPVNDAPVAADQAVSTLEDTSLPFTLAATDAEGDALTFVVVGAPTHGTLTGTASDLIYTPAADYSGPDGFTFRANDGQADSNLGTVSITVTPVNDYPVAAGDAYSVSEDQALVVAAPGVLGNDTDLDGDTLAAAAISQPAHGVLALNANGSFTYLPDADYNGADSFTYRADDGRASSGIATVTLFVAPVNDAPVAMGQSLTTVEDTAVSVNLAATDADGDALIYTVVSAPTHGALTGTAPNLLYTPTTDYAGTDGFTFRASDAQADSSLVTVTITVTPVNDAPVAQAQTVATLEDTPVGVALAASDVEGDALTYAVVGAPAHGALSGSNRILVYTPSANYNGPDSFTFRASDGQAASNTATVTLTVTAVNDAPVANGQSVSTNQNQARSVTLGATDVDGDSLTYSIVASPAHGSLSGSAPSVVYTPATGYSGPDSFTFRASDGQANSNTATISITVVQVNGAPVANSDSYAITARLPLLPFIVSAPGVLGNDTDANGDPLTAQLVSDVAHGALTLNSNGSFYYLPALLFSGVDTFSYRVNDGHQASNIATVSIVVPPLVPPVPLTVTSSVSKSVLSPPNHDLVDVGLSIRVSGTNSAGSTVGVAVYSNEDDVPGGGGDDARYSPDAKYASLTRTLRLRAERPDEGAGRVYLIVVTATNAQGETAQSASVVVVPRSQSLLHQLSADVLAATTLAYFYTHQAPPPGAFVVADGPVIGTKQ